MVVNGSSLLQAQPIRLMCRTKEKEHGVSWGLGEAGYDIRIQQGIHFKKGLFGQRQIIRWGDTRKEERLKGRFVLASAREAFAMPEDMVGIVHDKSSWARRGLSVFNTVIEPGWQGFLTLELVYHGDEELMIPPDAGIAQVIFHRLSDQAAYNGKYQHQISQPVPAIAA